MWEYLVFVGYSPSLPQGTFISYKITILNMKTKSEYYLYSPCLLLSEIIYKSSVKDMSIICSVKLYSSTCFK